VVGDRHDRGWRKLGLFGAELAALLEGPVLYLDLDIAVVQRLEPFFDLPGEFLIIKDFKPLRYRHRFSGNSSVIRFHAGAHPGLIAELRQRGARIRADFRDEQEFVSDYMRRQGVLQYWPSGWCASFKHDCVRPLPLGLWQEPQLPDGAKVLVFHGRPKPDEAIIGSARSGIGRCCRHRGCDATWNEADAARQGRSRPPPDTLPADRMRPR
jgi:hypothetical protein